jgi:phospholipid transport system transporter-binding protein
VTCRPQVVDLWQRRADWWQDDRIELGAVTTLDSAGLPCWSMGQSGTGTGATPTLVGASNDFHTLANLYGVASLFHSTPLTTEDS